MAPINIRYTTPVGNDWILQNIFPIFYLFFVWFHCILNPVPLFDCAYAGCYVDAPSAVSDGIGGNTRALQLRAASFPVPDASCSIQAHDHSFNDCQQQFGDVVLPSNSYSSNNTGGSSYSASLAPHPTFPLPWSHGLSSDADYYGHGMVIIRSCLCSYRSADRMIWSLSTNTCHKKMSSHLFNLFDVLLHSYSIYLMSVLHRYKLSRHRLFP